MHRHLLLIASAAVLASCGEQKSSAPATTEPPAEATASAQPTAPAATPAAAPAGGEITDAQAKLTLATLDQPYNAADLAKGRASFARCSACHTLKEGGASLSGPNLWNLLGRPVGSTKGFTYSPAMKEADFTWDTANLDRWLDDPRKFMPGNRMMFTGYHDATGRRDLIAYIATQTQAPPKS